jgi:hypothetical protein
MIYEIFSAFFVLGIPVFLVTWYLLRRLYRTGLLEQGVDYETLKSKLKGMKKDKNDSGDILHRNWMKFGGGFYGVTAVATLILIEIADLFHFIVDFPGFAELFQHGIVSLIVDLIINQIQNFITAILWFAHWGEGGQGMVLWALMAYFAYWCGLRAAERSLDEWQQWLELRLEQEKSGKDS